MSDASELKDADKGPHESWCDTQNAISQRCNCMASSYIDQIEDHNRILAERDELWKRATKFVMPGDFDTGESIEHYIKTLEQTIARQARVIENLKDVVTCVGCDANEWCPYAWDGYNTNGDCLADK